MLNGMLRCTRLATLHCACSVAPVLLQARMCSNFTSQVACEKTSFCAYNAQAKACARAVVAKMGVSAYDDRVGALMVGAVGARNSQRASRSWAVT